jgi:hypothetical protein
MALITGFQKNTFKNTYLNVILDITQKNLKLKAKDLIAFCKTKAQNFLTRH